MLDKYTFSVAWSGEDEAFVARVAEFPSLAAHGDSQQEALGEMRQVLEAVISDLEKDGALIPPPFGERRFSGRMNVRMPESLHRRLALEAQRQGVSLNQLINVRLAAGLQM